jgi:hypothetical protein
MVEYITILAKLAVSIIIFAISSLPLYYSVRFLGGKGTLPKTMMLVFISGGIISAIQQIFKIWGGLIAFLVMIYVYHVAFRLSFLKALLAWFLQFVIVALFFILFIFIFITTLGMSQLI